MTPTEEKWKELLRTKSLPEADKLEVVNLFFNTNIRYASDLQVWKTQEYWATPEQLVALEAGDCEDYAIAKYFTLKMLGVAVKDIKIMYARLCPIDVAHMVLLYKDMLVLDNIRDEIKDLDARSDLAPVLGFNHDGLWMYINRQPQLLTANHEKLFRWNDLLKRMRGEK